MVRPHKPRRIGHQPAVVLYKPCGVPATRLDRVELTLDELEALRLVDAESFDQATAAEHMNVSRATVGRILSSGREKVATALNHGMAIAIGSGAADVEFYNGCPKRGRNRGCQKQAQPPQEITDENSN